jgi:Domain of unknown function (DUF4398)
MAAPRHPIHTDRTSDGRIYSAQACGLQREDGLWEGWLAFFRTLTSGSLPAGATTLGTQVGGAASRTAEERGLDVDNWVGRRQWRGVAGAALVAVMAAGCASGDAALASAKVNQAERAVNEAKQSNAGVTAPVELKTAEDKLTAARAAAAKGEHNEAMRQADQALADADYARARASNAQVKKIADDMRRNIQTLRQELERLPR